MSNPNFTRSRFSVLFSALALLTAQSALAEGNPATPATRGDHEGTVVTPHLDFTQGKIRQTTTALEVNVGMADNSSLGRALRIEAAGVHPLYLWGKVEASDSARSKSTFSPVEVGAGARVQAEIQAEGQDRGQVRRLEIDSPTVAFVTYNSKSYRVEDITARLKRAGKGWNDLYSMSDEQRLNLIGDEKPYFTGSFVLIEGKYVFRSSDALATRFSGAQIDVASFSIHGATQLNNSVTIDACLYGTPIGVFAGQRQIGQDDNRQGDVMLRHEVGACLGVGLGILGHLRTDANVGLVHGGKGEHDVASPTNEHPDATDSVSWTRSDLTAVRLSARLERFMNTPVTLGAEYLYEHANKGGEAEHAEGNQQLTVTGGVAF